MPIYCEPDADIGFVYVWFNRINHRYYIGSRKGHPNDGYIGSGVAFKSAYKKYGPENFVRHIEYYGPDYRQEETDLIRFFDACNCPESYNIMHIDQTGCSISDATRAKMSVSKKGKKRSLEAREAISRGKTGLMRKPFAEEHRAKMSAARKGVPKPKIECPHCGKVGGNSAMKRYHFDNCKVTQIDY